MQTGSTGCGSTKPYPTIHFKTKGDHRVIFPPGDSRSHLTAGLSTTSWTTSQLEGVAYGGSWEVYSTGDVSTGYTNVTCSAAG